MFHQVGLGKGCIMSIYSIYKDTPNEDYVKGYYVPVDIPMDDSTDYYITIEPKYNQKPGLLALDLYGTERLEWIFYYFNKEQMDDIIFSLKTGIMIRIPTKARLMKYF